MNNTLLVPDRYDILKRKASNQLRDIIYPVKEALEHIDALYMDMIASCRGSFLIVRGDSGTGKSTFLHTIGFFRESIETFTASKNDDLSEVFGTLVTTDARLRIVILEGREALTDVSNEDLEKAIHIINAFVRTEEGEKTIIAWPVNRDDLAQKLSELAVEIGSEALIGAYSDLSEHLFW